VSARAREYDAYDEWELEQARRERERDEAEYQQGVAEARTYQQEKELFGEELANQWDMERELRRGDG